MNQDQQYNIILDYFELEKDETKISINMVERQQEQQISYLENMKKVINKVSYNVGELEDKLKKKEKLIENQKEELLEVEKTKIELKQLKTEMQDIKEMEQNHIDSYNELRRENVGLIEQLQETTKQKNMVSQNYQATQRIVDDLQDQIQCLERERREQQDHVTQRVARQEGQLIKIKEESNKLEDIIKQQNKEYYQLKEQYRHLETQLLNKDKKIQFMEQCEINYYKLREQLDTKEEEIMQFKQEIRQIRSQNNHEKEEKEEINRGLYKDHKKMQSKIDKLKEKNEILNQDNERMANKIKELEQRVDKDFREIGLKEMKIKKYSEELKRIQERVLEVTQMSNSVIEENEGLKFKIRKMYDKGGNTMKRQLEQQLNDTVDALYRRHG